MRSVMKIYFSSTLSDLRDYRASVEHSLRSMGHDVIGMEQYVAENTTPLAKCLDDVGSADVYLLICAWRYGYIPVDPELNPDGRSITELELEAAEKTGKTVLAFLLDPETPWPPAAVDAFGETGTANILRLRAKVGSQYLAGIFSSPDNLASRAAVAVARLGIRQQMFSRILKLATVTDTMAGFLHGNPLTDTTLRAIREMISGAGLTRVLLVQTGPGHTWWSTRLYLLAVLAQTLTGVRQFVFSHSDGAFAGMASPTAVREGLKEAFPPLSDFDAALRADNPSKDINREIDRCVQLWATSIGPSEETIKVDVRPQLLVEWFGERLIRRCLRLSPSEGLSIVQVQQLVESLIPDVPVEERTQRADLPPQAGMRNSSTSPDIRLMVVDRDAFTLELAREWVRTEMPRIPIR